jgi:hypothetical protein
MNNPALRGLAATSLLLLVASAKQEPVTTVYGGCRHFLMIVPLHDGPMGLSCNWSGGATYFRCTRVAPTPPATHTHPAGNCGNPLGGD